MTWNSACRKRASACSRRQAARSCFPVSLDGVERWSCCCRAAGSARQRPGDLGLVTEVVPRGQLDQRASALLRQVLSASDSALAAAKRAVHEGGDMPLPQALALEYRLGAALTAGARAVEA